MKTLTTTNPAPIKVNSTTYRVESRTDAGCIYTVLVLADGLSCNCAAGMNGRNCWHTAAVERKIEDGKRCQARPAKQMPPIELGMALLMGKGR